MAPNVVWLQKMPPNACRKTNEDLLFDGHTENGVHGHCGRILVGKSCTTTFRASLGKFAQNFSHPQKFARPTPMSPHIPLNS